VKRVLKTGIFVAAVAGLTLAVFVAGLNLKYAHRTSARNACINNLRQLDGATQQWILESGNAPTNTPTWSEIKPYLSRGTEDFWKHFHCPKDRSKTYSNSYILGSATVPPRCKIDPKHKLN